MMKQETNIEIELLVGKLLREIDSLKEDLKWLNRINKMKSQTDKKEKVLVVPYIEENNSIKVMSVLNRRYNEWGFISGTIEYRETYMQAAQRELYEESKKAICIDIRNKEHYSFYVFGEYIDSRKRIFHTKYNVVLIKMNEHIHTIQKLEKNFQNIKIIGREYNENTKLELKSTKELMNEKNLWPLMKTVINKIETFIF